MGDTQKVRSTGRVGSRYGGGLRKKLLKVESRQGKSEKRCPNCGSLSVKRKAKGIFRCGKCLHEFVGGAYLCQTLTGGIIRQMVSQKKFVPEMVEELEKVKEGEAVSVSVEQPGPKSEEAKAGQGEAKEGE